MVITFMTHRNVIFYILEPPAFPKYNTPGFFAYFHNENNLHFNPMLFRKITHVGSFKHFVNPKSRKNEKLALWAL